MRLARANRSAPEEDGQVGVHPRFTTADEATKTRRNRRTFRPIGRRRNKGFLGPLPREFLQIVSASYIP